MSIMTDELADDFGAINGPGTFTVAAYAINPTGDKVGNLRAEVCGIGANGNTFHAVLMAGWKMVGSTLTVLGLSPALSVVPVGLTGLVATVVASGNELQIRVTLIAGQNVTGAWRFNVMSTE